MALHSCEWCLYAQPTSQHVVGFWELRPCRLTLPSLLSLDTVPDEFEANICGFRRNVTCMING